MFHFWTLFWFRWQTIRAPVQKHHDGRDSSLLFDNHFGLWNGVSRWCERHWSFSWRNQGDDRDCNIHFHSESKVVVERLHFGQQFSSFNRGMCRLVPAVSIACRLVTFKAISFSPNQKRSAPINRSQWWRKNFCWVGCAYYIYDCGSAKDWAILQFVMMEDFPPSKFHFFQMFQWLLFTFVVQGQSRSANDCTIIPYWMLLQEIDVEKYVPHSPSSGLSNHIWLNHYCSQGRKQQRWWQHWNANKEYKNDPKEQWIFPILFPMVLVIFIIEISLSVHLNLQQFGYDHGTALSSWFYSLEQVHWTKQLEYVHN